ncbi:MULTISPECIES: superoxide dismutase[Cu-Zn] [Mycobacteriaceae]|uniref:Superoxide dismutase [Cu-Zn] n=3 Tax=Mycobacteriaceae TaxID=1762 RepID=A0A7I9YG94_MYCAL|nr:MULTISPECIES: superoxide dismutase family protein [Mycobacteriaceae]OQZ98733.1 superoxide dismutase [Mycolicibacter algericus DSM 45454]BBX12334.1 superoxide dismutase [Cu-Zn] [Mycobacterium novum]GFG87697.1 superoxide dismutase [Cu-Zn] [Mycolicibacter algericus]
MVKGHRRVVAAAVFAAPVVLLAACSPNEPPSDVPGTTPAIWTGSPAPSGAASEPGESGGSDNLVARLTTVDGGQVATATFEFSKAGGKEFATITVETTSTGVLTPGFHGMHIHGVGKCEADSVAPGGGAPGAFLSAGGHFQAPGHNEHPQSGDLTSLQVRSDGSALLVTTTDAFTRQELLDGEGTSLIIHADDDNFANIPADRYTQVNGTPGPDQTTLTTGDAGKRVACGVIGAG